MLHMHREFSRWSTNFRLGLLGILGIALIECTIGVADEKTFYIQAVKVDLHENAQMSAGKVALLQRGDKVEKIDQKNNWFLVNSPKGKGWLPKLFVSPYKPIGKADLVNEVPANAEKATRRRSSSFAVSASARGLMANERGREGQDLYRSDFEALEKLEHFKVSKDRFEKFRTTAKLPGE
jgi:hypothetical protein